MSLSADSLELFRELLAQLSLQANHPDFERQAARIVRAKNELAAIDADPRER